MGVLEDGNTRERDLEHDQERESTITCEDRVNPVKCGVVPVCGARYCAELREGEFMGWYCDKDGRQVKIRPSICMTDAFDSSRINFEEEGEVWEEREGKGGKGTRNPRCMKVTKYTML